MWIDNFHNIQCCFSVFNAICQYTVFIFSNLYCISVLSITSQYSGLSFSLPGSAGQHNALEPGSSVARNDSLYLPGGGLAPSCSNTSILEEDESESESPLASVKSTTSRQSFAHLSTSVSFSSNNGKKSTCFSSEF